MLPIVAGAVGVDQADGAVGRGHFHRQGQGLQLPGDGVEQFRGGGGEPAAAVFQHIDLRIRVAQGEAPGHEVVVAADGVEPRLRQPVQHLGRFRPAIDQIADGEQPVLRRVEADVRQCLLQRGEAAVDVAHGKVAPVRVGGDGDKAGGTHDVALFHHRQLGNAQRQPFAAVAREVHLGAGVVAGAFDGQHAAFAEFGVEHLAAFGNAAGMVGFIGNRSCYR